MATITTRSGATRLLPADLKVSRVAGLDRDGRIVVDDWMARDAKPSSHALRPFMFGLTLCCNASDKGVETGVVCRACYGGKPNADEGHYLFRNDSGEFPGLDPVASIS